MKRPKVVPLPGARAWTRPQLDCLQSLAARGEGRLTPDAMVEEARKKSSPLHSEFEWDDSIAAHRYRLDQARELLSTIRIVTKTETRTVSSVAYVRDPSAGPGEQGYVSVEVVRHDKQTSREVMAAEFSRIAALAQRTAELAASFGVFEKEAARLRDLATSLADQAGNKGVGKKAA